MIHEPSSASRRYKYKTPEDVERIFWSKVAIKGPDDCWEWTRSTSKLEYGTMWNGVSLFRTHRYALESKLGRKIAPGFYAIHSCGNRVCCNPAHIDEKTRSEATRDKKARPITNNRRLWLPVRPRRKPVKKQQP